MPNLCDLLLVHGGSGCNDPRILDLSFVPGEKSQSDRRRLGPITGLHDVLILPGLEFQPVRSRARSLSLCRLSYRGPTELLSRLSVRTSLAGAALLRLLCGRDIVRNVDRPLGCVAAPPAGRRQWPGHRHRHWILDR
jgi:hypothetical protein